MELALVVLFEVLLRDECDPTNRTEVVELVTAAGFSVRVDRVCAGLSVQGLGRLARLIIGDWHNHNRIVL